MGMSPKEMECTTYYDIGIKVKGFREYMAARENWMRNVAYSAYSPHLGRKAKTLPVEKFWPIPEIDDKRKKANRLTPERRQRVGAAIKDIIGATSGKTRDDN